MAAFQPGPGLLLGMAGSAADARVMLEALEAGTAGVVLRTEDPLQVCGDSCRRPCAAVLPEECTASRIEAARTSSTGEAAGSVPAAAGG